MVGRSTCIRSLRSDAVSFPAIYVGILGKCLCVEDRDVEA